MNPFFIRFIANWHKGRKEILKARKEWWRDGNLNDWVSSYALAPLFWIVTLGVAAWYAQEKYES